MNALLELEAERAALPPCLLAADQQDDLGPPPQEPSSQDPCRGAAPAQAAQEGGGDSDFDEEIEATWPKWAPPQHKIDRDCRCAVNCFKVALQFHPGELEAAFSQAQALRLAKQPTTNKRMRDKQAEPRKLYPAAFEDWMKQYLVDEEHLMLATGAAGQAEPSYRLCVSCACHMTGVTPRWLYNSN